VSALDFFPTLCEIAGARLPRGERFDGVDISAALFGKELTRNKPLFFEYGRNTNSFTYPREAQNRSPNIGVRDRKWKLMVNSDGTGTELYDVFTDPKETTDVSSKHVSEVKRLKKAVLAWRRSLP